jgi:hypothetical protein
LSSDANGIQTNATHATVDPTRHRCFVWTPASDAAQLLSGFGEGQNIFSQNSRNYLACFGNFHDKSPGSVRLIATVGSVSANRSYRTKFEQISNVFF